MEKNTAKKKVNKKSVFTGIVILICTGALFLAFDKNTAKERIESLKKAFSKDEEDVK